MIDYLKKNGMHYEVIKHASVFTAHETTVVPHVPDKELAKTLRVQTDNKYCMVVMPADHRLDENLLCKAIKTKQLHLAQEEDLKLFFPDCELGAMPPFGNLYALPVYVEKSLTNDDEIVFNACSHTKSIRLKMNDYLQSVKPVIAEFTRSMFETKDKND